MKLNIMSDLHLEFETMEVPTEGDVLILAGDITVGPEIPDWLGKALDNFEHTIMVLGNHEFYHHEYHDVLETWLEYKSPRFTVLHNNHLQYKGIRFIGSTMWTPYPACTNQMNDYHVIKYNERIITPQITKRLNSYANSYLAEAVQFPGKRVVITHHAPIPECVQPHYIGDMLNGNFHAHLNPLIEDHDIPLWIHGHMHDSIDFVYANTRIVCNPKGYYDENKRFLLNKIVEIESEYD